MPGVLPLGQAGGETQVADFVMPAAVGQPQNSVGAGVAVNAFNPDGMAPPPTVALAIAAAFQPFLAA